MIIAGTGHRPDKIGGYSDKAHELLIVVALKMIEKLKPTKIITGMALGWDMALADAAICEGIPFIAAIPFRGQERLWPTVSKKKYNNLLYLAEKVECVSEGGYSAEKMTIRNMWMVNNCDKVLALWNGTKGGTNNCVSYAVLQNKPIENCWPVFEEEWRRNETTRNLQLWV